MRIIFLNTWYAKVKEPFWQFLEKHASTTDIFCFQEVSPETFKKISSVLKNHKGVFESAGWSEVFKIESGQAVFLGGGFKPLLSKKVSIYPNTKGDRGFLLYVVAKKSGRKLTIGNVHGKALPGEKGDTPTRLKQSQKIIDLFNKKGTKIIGGDFNLMPYTESVKMFEKAGYRNLIRDFGIKNTRNRISWEKFGNVQHFSDYVFTSPEIKVRAFDVPYVEVSDHLPLILDFEV